MNNSPELVHYGVKGMKWGVRKTPRRMDISSDDRSGLTRNAKAYLSRHGYDKLSDKGKQEIRGALAMMDKTYLEDRKSSELNRLATQESKLKRDSESMARITQLKLAAVNTQLTIDRLKPTWDKEIASLSTSDISRGKKFVDSVVNNVSKVSKAEREYIADWNHHWSSKLVSLLKKH